MILSGGTSHTPKIASALSILFPETTTILSPSTSTTAINPSHLASRGAAIQASLVQEFEKDDIDQSTHPMLTVTSHLSHAIGVVLATKLSSNNDTPASDVFSPLLLPETAVPARRSARFPIRANGDLLIQICEGAREIRVEKPEPKLKINGTKVASDSELGSDDDDDDDDEEEEKRTKVWRASKTLAELRLKDVKKEQLQQQGKKKTPTPTPTPTLVEVTVNVGGDLGIEVTAREVGGKGGVRGRIEGGAPQENGTA